MIVIVLLLTLLESLRWPEAARSDFLAYAADPLRFQYFALPLEAQWPMNIWNRAPLQVFLNMGLKFGVSQALSLALYALALGASLFLLRGRRIGFAIIFALAYVLFLVGRPITWSMPFLAIFTLTAAWPALTRTERRLGVFFAFLIGSTHWAAFLLFAAGVWPGLLTLQVPGFPWETLVVLFIAWATLIFSSRRTVGHVGS